MWAKLAKPMKPTLMNVVEVIELGLSGSACTDSVVHGWEGRQCYLARFRRLCSLDWWSLELRIFLLASSPSEKRFTILKLYLGVHISHSYFSSSHSC